MTEDQITRIIFNILRQIAPESDPAALAPNENIRRALDIDSFDALNFFIHLHEELGVNIPESDYGQLNTLSEMLHYLSARVTSAC
jgi:acyl carrier protein